MNIPEGLYYTESHEWMRFENGLVRIGVTDFAQHELTDIVFVELPEPGSQVEKGAACCVVESTKVAADVYAPLSGTIAEVNSALVDHPELINQSPYDEGWLYLLKPDQQPDLSLFLNSAAYQKKVGGEG